MVRRHVRDLNYPEYATSHDAEDCRIDLSLGESPGLPERIKEGIGTGLNKYRKAQDEKLISSIAEYLGIPGKNILITAGCDGAIGNFCSTFLGKGEVSLIPSPSFPRYEFHSKMQEGRIEILNTDYPFEFDPELLIEECSKRRPNVLFFCNPNNPTGHHVKRERVIRLLESSAGLIGEGVKGPLIFIDEALADYKGETCSDLVSKYPHLVVGRSFSKLFGLAGMRLGYAVASDMIKKEMGKVVSPFEVSSKLIEAATLALHDTDFIEERRRNVRGNLGFMNDRLGNKGYKMSDSSTCLSLVYGGETKGLYRNMLDHGIKTVDGNEFPCLKGHNAVRLNLDCRREYLESFCDALSG